MYLSFFSSLGLAYKVVLIKVSGVKQPKNLAFPLFAGDMDQKFLMLNLVFDKGSYFLLVFELQ